MIVYSGDGDISAIGGNHFIHAAKQNIDITVICVNNFNYGMTGGQAAPTSPTGAILSTTPYGNFEEPFNLPYLAEACGAVYVARWTAYRVSHVARSMREALQKKGFSFIEIITPCPTLYSRRNKLGDGIDEMKYYKEKSRRDDKANLREISIQFHGEIVIGKFVDREKPTYLDAMNTFYSKKFGDRFVPYAG